MTNRFSQVVGRPHRGPLGFFRKASRQTLLSSPEHGVAPSVVDQPRLHRDDRYRITGFRSLAHNLIGTLPPLWREGAAERFLRRDGAPGPAAEHVFQYLLSAAKSKRKTGNSSEATVAKGADHFYERQYRQYFNAVMGAFAMTATRALLGSGGAARGRLWRRRRRTYAAMLDQDEIGAPPIIVINCQTVAIPVLLPKPSTASDGVAIGRWLSGRGALPPLYRRLVAGEEVRCAERGARAYERRAVGASIEIVDAVLRSRKLAVLALHPFDSDAMGLHVTLFGVQVLTSRFVEQDYGLDPLALHQWRSAAEAKDSLLVFCVGGTEEIFTQCSQNLFVKRPMTHTPEGRQAASVGVWNPALPLERLIDAQFELLQITVSASGLPGASPRNGDRGRAAFVERRNSKTYVLMPYYAGNAIHGHAAKLWSNGFGSLVIWDDTWALRAMTISGPSRVVAHHAAMRDFPSIAPKLHSEQRRNGAPTPDPEYWFVQEVAQLTQQSEPLAANSLDPVRPTCSISAGGRAIHGKKPVYFAADALPPYDQSLQHEREAAGRPLNPTGDEHRLWNETVRGELKARQERLAGLLGRTEVAKSPEHRPFESGVVTST